MILRAVPPPPPYSLSTLDRDSSMLLSRVNRKIQVYKEEIEKQHREFLLEELADAVHTSDSSQQWFLTYRLADTGRGPKNRCFKRPPARRPLSDVWAKYLAKNGPEG